MTTDCFRFVKDDLTSENGQLSWRVGEWNTVSGALVCCSNGLHAAWTPRDSLRNVCGRRWFVSEARGEIVEQGDKFAASEMRLVKEIPVAVLQRFALWCAEDCVQYYEDRFPEDEMVAECIQAAGDYLDGRIDAGELAKKRDAAGAGVASGGAPGRAAATAIAATMAAAAPDAAAWASAAAASAHAAHAVADAHAALIASADAQAAAGNVASVAAAATAADTAAAKAHVAAAAGAAAHAAAVAAARDVALADTAADAYYAAYAAYPARAVDSCWAAQDKRLSEMIARHFAVGGIDLSP
jgi:hypothetical protein